tara:strand:+ start:2817 stop:3455 length:639 start_codon:yes stop_codon:yes gene_type:complete
MLKADYVELIENHFEAQGKKMSNLSKATLPKLKEIIEKYNIKYDEKAIVAGNEEIKIKQKKEKEEQDKERDEKWEKEKAEKQERIELWNSLIDETKDNIVMFIVIKKHKNYLEFYWRNKKANKRLGEEVDKMEAKFKEEIGEDKVERKGLNHLCIKGVNLHHGFLYEDWNQEKEIKQVINDAKNGWKFNIDEILKQINEEELKEREKGCWFD